MTYVITAQQDGNDFSSGIVLSTEEAPNPEEALHHWGKRTIDEEFLDFVNSTGITPRDRVTVALWLLVGILGDNAVITIYEVAVDADGEPVVLTLDDLAFEPGDE